MFLKMQYSFVKSRRHFKTLSWTIFKYVLKSNLQFENLFNTVKLFYFIAIY